ncbi:hypothetical protein WJX72_011371 [[Myrmecia] bisecta]|uniref:glutathione dehydrogenase (ascorbate) n=1 Tax=[Myrmecia] bisecta TaxID=41462 RepID=A0AAW1R9E1_9CHLO
MAVQPAYEAWVKGDPKTSTLGDCPFCHRVLLTLEEKEVPYTKGYIDLYADKPAWLFEVNEKGSVPVVKDLETQEWLIDSADIVDHLEQKHPEPGLGTSKDIPEAGSKVFPAFVQYLKSSGAEEGEKREALLKELDLLNSHLEQHGPFLKGQDISAGDLALAPKLYHLTVALKAFKDFTVPERFTAVTSYLAAVQGRQSWKNTHYSEELVLKGWKAHLQG